MPKFRQLTDRATVAVALAPVSKTAGTTTSAAVSMLGFGGGALLVNAGVIGTSGTVDCKITTSAATGGTYTDVTGAAITQMTQAGGGSGTSQLVSFDMPLGHNFVKTVLVNATAAAIQGVFVIQDKDLRSH
tara:strand:+ start:71 stop:463 length:393 start_codon:yes stop_codon:yes gene_type:complete